MTLRGLRILHILGNGRLTSSPDEAPMSGVVRAVLELARFQAAKGHHVTVVGLADTNWASQWRGCSLVGLRPVRMARLSIAGRVIDLSRHFAFVLYSRLHQFDVVHGHLHPFLRWIRGQVKVVHFHADPFFKGTTDLDVSWASSDFLSASRHSTFAVAVSEFVAQRVRRGFAGLAYSVYPVENGVDLSTFDRLTEGRIRERVRADWKVSANAVICLFIGAITPEKGLRELALAFSNVATTVPNLSLFIVGSGSLWGTNVGEATGVSDYEHAVRISLDSLTSKGRVRFLGKVAASDMPELLAGSDLVVVPTLGAIVQEAFGLAALEAMAAGRPVIVSQSGNLPFLVTENEGRVVDETDSGQLCAALADAARDETWREEKGRGAYLRARQYSWTASVERLDEIYAQYFK